MLTLINKRSVLQALLCNCLFDQLSLLGDFLTPSKLGTFLGWEHVIQALMAALVVTALDVSFDLVVKINGLGVDCEQDAVLSVWCRSLILPCA
ncbi:hypothetical protein AB1K62_11670 [Parasphingorhabdus sp. JC815]|uniref:hypothetical protein n=1 Tax=Parasphingorhabdus sp. JC815 TaxID=3232140 RepID=UPI00345ACA49